MLERALTQYSRLGLYQKFANNVTVEYKENGKAMKLMTTCGADVRHRQPLYG